jgi:aminoglycoside phosphotransferase (APT) family kinase protein
MNIIQLLRYINICHGTAFELASKLEGGHQDGAYVLVEPRGRRAVLKQMFAPRALPIVGRLRAAGYPTPGVLYDGVAADGTTYLVQEFVPGAPIRDLTEAHLDQIFMLNQLQADLNPNPDAHPLESWSGYVRDVVFARSSVWERVLSNHSKTTASLLAALRQLTGRYAHVALPNTDAVHGDLHSGNILVQDGRVTGVIDMVYAGYGTRAIDLASLLHSMDSHQYAPAVYERLRGGIIERFGPEVYAICMAYRVIVTVEWAIRNRLPDWIDHFVSAGWAVCNELEWLNGAADIVQ